MALTNPTSTYTLHFSTPSLSLPIAIPTDIAGKASYAGSVVQFCSGSTVIALQCMNGSTGNPPMPCTATAPELTVTQSDDALVLTTTLMDGSTTVTETQSCSIGRFASAGTCVVDIHKTWDSSQHTSIHSRATLGSQQISVYEPQITTNVANLLDANVTNLHCKADHLGAGDRTVARWSVQLLLLGLAGTMGLAAVLL